MPCSATQNEFEHHFLDESTQQQLQSRDSFSDAAALPHYQPRLPLHPSHVHLSLEFDIPLRRLIGSAQYTLQAKTLNATTIIINAEDFISISASSPTDNKLSFTYDSHVLHVEFSHPIPKSQTVQLHIDFIVEDPIDGLFFSRPYEGFFVVSDHETERARYWLPVVDHPSVRTTIDFDILTPVKNELTVLANGELVDETIDTSSGKKTTRWQMKHPTPSYILCVAIGKFIRADVAPHRGKPVAFFAPSGARIPYTVEDLALTFGRTKEMLSFMEEKVKIELPWPKYFQWACGEVSGAMENSSLVSYDEWYLLDERSVNERAHRVDRTVVHELAHTWFGNMVVCDDFCHSFLKEAFATLMSAEWYQYKNGNDDFQYTLLTYANTAFAETNEYMRPIVTRKYNSSWSLFDSHLYVNGAWRLHMLRVILGDQEFWGAVSAYLTKRAWTTVETDDFRKDLECFSGEQLTSYFDQWFYSKGHPVLEAVYAFSPKDKTVSFTLKQVQYSEQKNIPLFDICVDVAFEMAEGKWETFQLDMRDGSLTAQIVIKVASKPLQVVIDPNMKVLHKLSRICGLHDDISFRMLKKAPTVTGRHQAICKLGGIGSKLARRALCEALKCEKFWGLRILIAEALAKTGCQDVISSLIDAMFHESDARVVPSLVASVSDMYDVATPTVIEEALLKFIHDGEEQLRGYGAMAAALRGLGKTGNTKYIDLLCSFIRDENKRGGSFEMAQGAAVGLGLMRDFEATQSLMEFLEVGKDGRFPGRLRGAMVRAIANGVAMEPHGRRMKAFEFIVKQSRASDIPKGLRMACASGLTTLADAGDALGALDCIEKKMENQSAVIVQSLKRRATRTGSTRRNDAGFRSLSNRMEKLQSEVKELRGALDDLQVKLDKNEMTVVDDGK